jgi:hypothetical protein
MMFNRINEILFPNKCEVIKFDDAYIYPIFKNGRSSILASTIINNRKILINEQIKKLTAVDIIVRNPIDRYISGINTFVWLTKRDNPNLDVSTILYFAENYLFLNRHYAPQLSWVFNLLRYTNENVILRLHGMEYISTLTNLNLKPEGEEQLLHPLDIIRLKNNIHNEMYLRLDNILFNLIGQNLTFKEILEHLKQDPLAYSKIKCIALD